MYVFAAGFESSNRAALGVCKLGCNIIVQKFLQHAEM